MWRKGVRGPGSRSGKGPHVSEELNCQPVGLACRQPERVELGEKELEGAGCSQGDLRSHRAGSHRRTFKSEGHNLIVFIFSIGFFVEK